MPIPAPSPGYTTTLSVEEIATRVKRQFGDAAGIQIEDADIMRWINDAQREIAIQHDLLQTTSTTNVLANQQVYGKPTGILLLRSIHYNGRKLRPLSSQEAEEYISQPTIPTGEPTHFWLWANEITLYPTPQSAVTDGLKIYYTRHPIAVAEVADVPEIPPEYHTRIVEYCLQQAYELDENWTAAQMKGQQFSDGLAKVKDQTEQQTHDVYPHITSTDINYGW